MTERENRALYIAEECRKAGVTIAGTAGILENIDAESGFNPHNVQDTFESRVGNDETYTARVDNGTYHAFTSDGAGYGIAQWTASDRKAKLLAYCKQRGASIGDFRTQVDFMLSEMRGYSSAWSTVTSTSNPYEAGYNVCRYYEIPADTIAASEYRGNNAYTWYQWLINVMHNGDQSAIKHETPQPSAAQPPKDEDGIDIPKTWPPRTIDSKHCSGWPEIKLMQAALLCHGYNVIVDGIWSEDTTRKFTAFQTAANLAPDNVCGSGSWSALLSINRG